MTVDLLTQEDPAPISTGEEDMRQYLSEIRKFPLLTPEQEPRGMRLPFARWSIAICDWWLAWPESMPVGVFL